jgi:Cytochrome c554 and c-prime
LVSEIFTGLAMKKIKKITLLASLTLFTWIMFTGLVQFRHVTSYSLTTDVGNQSVQEKPKYRYVGMEKCASVCHNNEKMGFQYNVMKNNSHSSSFKTLNSYKAARYAKKAGVNENPQESQICLKCHVTGGGLDSTFFAATYRKEEGVTCEACHKGPFITKAFIPKETDCLNCHNNAIHKIPHFNFKENCKKIAHPRPI